MQRIIDSLHQKFTDMPNLRAREIRVDKQQRKVFCALSYPNVSELDRQLLNDIIAYVKTLVPQGYTAIVTFANDNFTEMGFKRFMTDLLKSKYPLFAVISKGMDVKVADNSVHAVFHVNATMNTNIIAAELTDKLTEYLAEYTYYAVTFDVVVDKEVVATAELSEQEKLVRLAINRELLKPSRCFTVTNVVKHIGKVILGSPMYIADIRKPSESCTVCGTVSGKTLKSSKNDSNMYVCKFTLTDESGGSITCVTFTRLEITDVNAIKENMGKTDSEAQTMSKTRAFANERKMKKLMDIYDGMEVVARGRIAFNKFSDQLEMTVYDLCKCRIQSVGNAAEYNKPVAGEYTVIKPQIYEEYWQTTFVNQIIGKSLLSDKSYVVLHVNATGRNTFKDKIFALGAVKIVDGHITESLFTYVNPEMDVPEATLSKGLTSTDKIVFYPTITEVISDLYKFTCGIPLVGVDLPQILEMLNYYASPVGYKFSNECVSQAELLSELFDNSIFNKKPNCSKLEDVARQCKVPFSDVQFCASSAITVAKSMVAIADNVK